MKELILEAQIRTEMGKRAKTLRRLGKVPGVYYLHGEPSVPISLGELALNPLQKTSETHVIRLKTNDGTERRCILREIAYDPVSDRPVHFDLQGFLAGEKNPRGSANRAARYGNRRERRRAGATYPSPSARGVPSGRYSGARGD